VYTIMPVYGTRPEAIKMAPLLGALEADERFRSYVVATGQHREMLDQVNRLFGIEPQTDLDIFQRGQTLDTVTVRTMERLTAVLEEVVPDAVVVQGDTTSAFVAGLAAFYKKIPVFHLEAGLRTDDIYNPFPEEANRRLVARIASLHLAPTSTSRDNLLREGVPADDIVVTGNTVIDALMSIVDRPTAFDDERVADAVASDRRLVLITAHRRESWGEPMEAIGRAVGRLADLHPDVLFLLPLHGNPAVQAALLPPVQDKANVVTCPSLEYAQFAAAMKRADVVLTDSGGVQEEAPSLGKPVLVTRTNTERPEAVSAGTVKLIGTDEDRIVHEVTVLLTDPEAYAVMAEAVNPYGDGEAGARSIAAIRQFFGIGERLPDFDPSV
jgi:UDP-N-acetylglucosamine 2-epimerase (non-hydrolysing)